MNAALAFVREESAFVRSPFNFQIPGPQLLLADTETRAPDNGFYNFAGILLMRERRGSYTRECFEWIEDMCCVAIVPSFKSLLG